jgi:hypothetical protein
MICDKLIVTVDSWWLRNVRNKEEPRIDMLLEVTVTTDNCY